jgi:hypothetical protein
MTYGAGFKYVILVVSARPTNKRPRDLAHVRFGAEHVRCTSGALGLLVTFTPLSSKVLGPRRGAYAQ